MSIYNVWKGKCLYLLYITIYLCKLTNGCNINGFWIKFYNSIIEVMKISIVILNNNIYVGKLSR